MSQFVIGSLKGHREATIRFAERFLLKSTKREQFERWRDELRDYDKQVRIGKGPSSCPSWTSSRLFDYWERRAKRVRP